MDNQKLEIILFKVGEKFIQYVLNFNQPIIEYDKLKFTSSQIEVLNEIWTIIIKCESQSSRSPYTTIKESLFPFGSYFNKCRLYCNGNIAKKQSGDELLNYLFSLATEYYSCLLINSTPKSFLLKYEFESPFPYSSEQELQFHNFFKNHNELKNICDFEDNFFSSRISYLLSFNNVGFCFSHDFVQKFITRSFLNCCYRTSYSLIDLLNDIENQYSNLIKIAKKESFEATFFCGVYGLKLLEEDEYYLADNILLRNINEINNPGIKETISVAGSLDGNDSVIGCVLEYRLILDSTGKWESNNSPIEEQNNFILEAIDNFINASIISLNCKQAPFRRTFFDKSLPIHIPTFHFEENFSSNINVLNINQLSDIKNWFKIFSTVDFKNVSLTISRIKSSIIDQTNPIDSILNAFIAWESMFSSDISTTNSVTKSFKIMLERANYQISQSKLSDLYKLRSAIVHGNTMKHHLFKGYYDDAIYGKLHEIRKEVIEITLVVLKELLKDKMLLEKSPIERVESLLNSKIEECITCGIKKYKFS